MDFEHIILILATLTSGLMAGLFFAWHVSVIPGLKNLKDRAYLETMQSINRAIQNPAFGAVFLGTVAFLLLACLTQAGQPLPIEFLLIATAALCYFAGVIYITFFGNVPLNNKLDAFKIEQASEEDIRKQREAFERPWNRYNRIRTYSSLITFLAMLLAYASYFLAIFYETETPREYYENFP